MPERIYTIRGQLSGASLQHEKIQMAWYDSNYLYRILDFRVYSTLPLRVATVSGTLSRGRNDTIDPEILDLEDQNIIAWSQQIRRTPVPPGLLEEASAYKDGWRDDDAPFGYDLWIHTNASTTAVDVNYYILIEKFKVSGRGRLVNDIEQYALNVAA